MHISLKKTLLTATAAAGIAASALTACSTPPGKNPVPLPHAYPRVPAMPATFHDMQSNGISMQVNDGTDAQNGRLGPVIYYQPLDATIYVTTLSNLADVKDTHSKRLDHMMRNFVLCDIEETRFANPHGFDVTIYSTTGRTPTPVQMIAVNPHGRAVVTASVFFPRTQMSAETVDSLRPLADTLTAQLTRLANSLRLAGNDR